MTRGASTPNKCHVHSSTRLSSLQQPTPATEPTTMAFEILHGIDTAGLPEAVVLDYVLAETLNGLTTHAGHESAVDFL